MIEYRNLPAKDENLSNKTFTDKRKPEYLILTSKKIFTTVFCLMANFDYFKRQKCLL
jgi:hypothetical protein